MAVYSYTISTTFPPGGVGIPRLVKEIVDSSIVPLLANIEKDVDNDSISITFVSVLSTSEQTVLDGIVATHGGPYPATTKAKGGVAADTYFTTAQTYQTAITLTMDNYRPGHMLLLWSLDILAQDKKGIEVQVRQNNTILFNSIYNGQTFDDDDQEAWSRISGFEEPVQAEAADSFDIRFRSKKNGKQVAVRNVRLMLWRS